MDALRRSFSALSSNLRIIRVFKEDDGVEGCGFFHRNPERPLHILGNILRVITMLAVAPVYVLTPRVVVDQVDNYINASWLLEYATTPDPVLTNARGGGKGKYDVTGFKPSWVMEVTIKDGKYHSYRQTRFLKHVEAAGYTALSYAMANAEKLDTEEENNAAEAIILPSYGPEYIRIRKKQARAIRVLKLYCSAERVGGNPDRTEYVWLDEFCILDMDQTNDDLISDERVIELGKLADIFRNAEQVAVFCNEEDCDHTGLDCSWGSRLWTFPEILNAQRVLRVTMVSKTEKHTVRISPVSGQRFREAIQSNAARGDKWHLYAIYQHSINSGAVPWQTFIHALLVEAIRRDDIGGYHSHTRLGSILNGLLPRRTRLEDLGSSGWNDLAWLLELNQGFYNAAALAAVCSIADDESVSWLGEPIHPIAGNERLEPIVTAFPVSRSLAAVKKKKPSSGIDKKSEPNPPLTIIGHKTIGLRPIPLKRDRYGLYNNEEMKGLKKLAYFSLFLLIVLSLYLFFLGDVSGALLLYWIASIVYCVLELLVGTMYLEREGWAFFEDAQWGRNLQAKLGHQDNHLRNLVHWGDRQLIPTWEAPRTRTYLSGKLVDLQNSVYLDVIVVSRPNAMIPLAIHGSGVTCILLDRPGDQNKPMGFFAKKVGMCNLPPYALAQTIKTGTVYVASDCLPADATEV
ncbi:hypothetical protein C8R44DRAFT_722073 [Mycena epipterygia]|nr:hypothetical protein C8R44DRAFT_722073 [Mycena epipterygia]